MRRSFGVPGVYALKFSALALFLVFSFEDRGPAPRPPEDEVRSPRMPDGRASPASDVAEENQFLLCSDPPADGYMIAIDFASGWSLLNDVIGPVETCRSGDACLLQPFTFGRPPRIPRLASDNVQWRVGNDSFSMITDEREPDRYIITATSPPIRYQGRTYPSQTRRIIYEIRTGITSYQTLPRGPQLVRCRGRLTFEDIEQLARPGIRSSQPPNFSAAGFFR